MSADTRFLTVIVTCTELPRRHSQDLVILDALAKMGLSDYRVDYYERFGDQLAVHFLTCRQNPPTEVAVFFQVVQDGN